MKGQYTPQPLLLKNLRIIDTVNREVHQALDVFIADGEIREIGRRSGEVAAGVPVLVM